jgi:protein TonB
LQATLGGPGAPRTGTLLLVVALHGVALATFAAATAIRERLAVIPALDVALLESPRQPPPEPPLVFRPELRDPPPVSIAAPEVTIVPARIEPVAAPPAPAPNPAPTITAVPMPAVAAAPAVATSPAIEAPRFDLAYLRNPPPAYPAASKRGGEKGRVVLRVHVTADGDADEVEIRTSSGYDRLDRAAIEAVRRWKFAPARRGAEPVPAYALVPVLFDS